jgi:hypothetical protein
VRRSSSAKHSRGGCAAAEESAGGHGCMLSLLLLCRASLGALAAPSGPPLGAAPEPFPPLHGGSFSGRAAPLSPDPLAEYVWAPSVNRSQLQIFTKYPSSVTVQAGSCAHADELAAASPRVTVTEPVRLLLDFGNENPAWLELVSDGRRSTAWSIRGKRRVPSSL